MRFVLDECVDARVRRAVVKKGHDCWTIPDAGLTAEDDDEVSVYADDRGAVLVTDDRALIARRRRDLFGRYLYLRCSKTSAVGVVEQHLDEAVAMLSDAEAIIVAISVERVWIMAPVWLME